MDHLKARPSLPGSTPAPAPGGKTSVYQSTAAPHFTEPGYMSQSELAQQQLQDTGTGTFVGESGSAIIHSGSITSSLAATQYRKNQERAINKIVSKLPYQLRDSVSSLMNMTLSASEIAQKNYEISHHELIDLRNELSRKSIELDNSQKTLSIYRSRLKGLSESMDTMKDDLDVKQKHALRNQKYLSRLSSTNKMLIGSLNALNVEPPSPNTRSADKRNRAMMLRPMAAGLADTDTNTNPALPQIMDASANFNTRPGSPSPESRPVSTAKPNQQHAAHAAHTMKTEQNADMANEKLRASLLRVAREHYLSQKQSEGLERKVDQLRHTLRDTEQKNRQLQNELNELKSVHSDESGGQGQGRTTSEGSQAAQRVESAVKVRSYGKIDDRFKACMKRETLKPESGLITARRIMELMAHAPMNLAISQVGPFLVSKEVNRIFDTEIVCLFLKQSAPRQEFDLKIPLNARPIEVHRYSVRADKPDSITITPKGRGEGRCLAHETFLTGHPNRSNNLHRVGSCDPAIDVCPGVVANRIMAIPLRSTDDNSCLGVMHFINKAEQYSEADELMALIFADCASALLTQSMALEKTKHCMNCYRRLLEAAVKPYAVIPDKNVASSKSVLGPAEILLMLEEISRDVLKCARTRAFLASSVLVDDPITEKGQLLMLNPTRGGRAEVTSVADSLGIAGHVSKSRDAYHVENSSSDERLNPQIDLEVLGSPVLSIPIIELDGTVLAVLQLTPGPSSPKLALPMRRSDSPADQLLFAQAAQWLAYQLVAPLKHICEQLRACSSASGTGIRPSVPSIYPLVFSEQRLSKFDANIGAEGLAAGRSRRLSLMKKAEEENILEMARLHAQLSVAQQASQTLGEKLAAVSASLSEAEAAASLSKAKAESAEARVLALEVHAAEAEALRAQVATLQARVADAERLAQAAVDSAAEYNEDGGARSHAEEGAGASAAPATGEESTELVEARKTLTQHTTTISTLTSELAAARASAVQAENQLEALKKNVQQQSEAVEADKQRSLAALRSEHDETNAALIAAMERCTSLQADKEALTVTAEQGASQLSASHAQVEEMQAQLDASQTALDKKDEIIAIIQAQIVKMAEDSISGIDLAALRESLAASVASARPTTGSPSVRPKSSAATTSAPAVAADGAALAGSAKPVARAPSSRPPTSGSALASDTAGLGATVIVRVEYPWTELVDDEGNVYYYNSETQESSWDPPAVTAATLDGGDSLGDISAAALGDWVQYWTEDGSPYYENVITGEKSWELPPPATVTDE